MLTYNDFREYYRKVSNTELIGILQNPEQYQTDALRAAKEEFDSRQLTSEDVVLAQELLLAEKDVDNKYLLHAQKIGGKISTSGSSFIRTLNPIVEDIPTPERMVRFIVAFMMLYYVVDLIDDFNGVVSTITFFSDEVFVSLLTLFPLIYLPIAIYLFWKKRKWGWILLQCYLVFNGVATLLMAIYWIVTPMPDGYFEYFEPPIGINLINFLMYGIFMYALCKPSIRTLFNVTRDDVWAAVILGAALNIFSIYILLTS